MKSKLFRIITAGALVLQTFALGFTATVVRAAAPETVITAGPSGSTNQLQATFEFISSDEAATFECQVDGGAFVACTTPYVVSDLEYGPHIFGVRSTNASDETDVSAATRAWLVVPFEDGDGSPETPYRISTCSELQAIELDLSASYVLTDDINCNGFTFSPIAQDSPFTGELDGDGFSVRFLDVTGDTNVGLFSVTDGASIHDLAMDYGSISGTSQVGAIVGYGDLETTIDDVHVRSTDVSSTGGYIGGIAGFFGNDSVISNTYFLDGSVTSSGSVYVGGLAADFQGAQIHDSYTKTTIHGDVAGGLVGTMGAPQSSITRSYSASTFDTLGTNNGGLVGSISGGASVTESFSVADLTTSGGSSIGAVFGDVGSATVTHVYFDQTRTGRANCAGSGEADCTAVNTDGGDSEYFINNTSNAPLNAWSFGPENSWHANSGYYPTLTPILGPIIECNAPVQTLTTISGHCDYLEQGWGTTTWEAQFKEADADEWTNITLDDVHLAQATVSGTSPEKDYLMRFRFSNDSGADFWATLEFTQHDSDLDGVNDLIESLGPNSGDANNDGTPDKDQAAVYAGISPVNNQYYVLQTTCDNNFNVMIGAESSDPADSDYDYPAGLVAFVGRDCGEPGATASIDLYFFGEYDPATTVLRKYYDGAYHTIDGVTFASETIGAEKVLHASYDVVDGSSLDQDGVADGNIVDPIGLATSTVAAPSTGLPHTAVPPFAVAALAGLLALGYVSRKVILAQ